MTKLLIINELNEDNRIQYNYRKDKFNKINANVTFYYMSVIDEKLHPLVNYFDYKDSIEKDVKIFKMVRPYYKTIKSRFLGKIKEHSSIEGYVMEEIKWEEVK